MSRIFLSHSRRDNRAAVALKQWLVQQRPELSEEIFLDIDPTTGMKLGAPWKSQLFKSTSRCEAVICLLSTNWEASAECKAEYRTAEGLGKRIVCASLEDIDTDITAEWQRCTLFADGPRTEIATDDGPPVRFNTAALNQVREAIEGSGMAPQNFSWPPASEPHRAPYRGWEPFEDIDAGVFFGRDAAIVRGLDELRAMRLSGPKSLFVVLGPSGSGKSSLLRAGLIPRLQREDRRFMVLGIVRPERHALTGQRGLATAIHTARRALMLGGAPLGEIKTACQHDSGRVIEVLQDLRAAAAERMADTGQHGPAPTLVLPLDQAEELFSADAGEQAEQFLTLTAELLDQMNATDVGLIVAATIRTDRYELMQNHPALDGIGTVLFNELKPMPPSQFREVITGPASRSKQAEEPVRLAPALVERLLAEANEGADTLPLLSLTLARLYTEWADAGTRELTVASYQAMGGMADVVNNEIEQILAHDPHDRQTALALLRSAFIPWLATINPDSDQPMRRVARYADLPEASRPLIDAMVSRRLMVKDTRVGDVVVEVALESLLRHFDELAGWLREERQNLIAADDVERNAAAWAAHHRDPSWLMAGTRLTDAETLATTPQFGDRLVSTRGYLAASRTAEDERLGVEERHRQAELRHAQERQHTAEAHAATLRRRSRILRAVLAVTVVIAIIAVVGFVQATVARSQAQRQFREATSVRLVSEAQAMLDRTRSGSDAQAFQQLLAAQSLAATPDDGAVYGAVVNTVTTHKIIENPASLSTVAYSPDGRRIASGSADHSIRLWDADTGQPVGKPLTGHQNTVFGVVYSPDGRRIASSSADHTIRLWDADTGQPIGQPLTGHQNTVATVAFSPDGRRIASGSADHTIRLWNADTGQPVGQPLAGHGDIVFSVAFSPDGHRLASASADHTVRLWNADTGQPIGQPLTGDTDIVFSVAFSPDGHRLASAGANDTIRLWNADTGQPLGQPLAGHSDMVTSVVFSPDGHRLASGSRDDTVRLWDADTGQPVGQPLVGHHDMVNSVAFSPDGRRIASGSADQTVRLWDPDAGRPLAGHHDAVFSVAFSPDGHRLASASADDTVRLWNADTGEPIGRPLTGHQGTVSTVAFSPDGRRIASGGADNTVRLWNADTGEPIGQPLKAHQSTVFGVAFSPDGHRLASASADHTVRLWDADTGQRIGQPLTGHNDMVFGVAFSPDGKRLASAGRDDTIRLWDADTGQPIGQPLTGHNDMVFSVAFSPDGKRLASGSREETIRLWDADTGQPIGQPLTGHQDTVYSVAFSPDGKRLASAGNDDMIRLWDSDTGRPFGQPITGHQDTVYSVAFSPDGKRIASASADHTLRLWPGEAGPGDLCNKVTANMTHQQWRDWVSPDIGYIQTCPGLPVPTD